MAKTFFENFREAGPIITFPRNNPYGANIPGLNGGNSGAWRKRVAVPFSFSTTKNQGNGKASKIRRSGILYLPYYEASKIRENGTVDSNSAEIYGGELDNISLTDSGVRKLLSDKNNSDFEFDIDSGANALAASQNRDTVEKDYSAGKFQASNGDFLRNLRKWLWGI